MTRHRITLAAFLIAYGIVFVGLNLCWKIESSDKGFVAQGFPIPALYFNYKDMSYTHLSPLALALDIGFWVLVLATLTYFVLRRR